MTIAIIGAGMAGLSAASALAAAGKSVLLFDKGRGAGGRMSTRRMTTPLGEVSWDHGAQYFTARSAPFIAEVQTWMAEGVCAEWTGTVRDDTADGRTSLHPRYVGVPGMNGVIRHLASGQSVAWGRRVVRIEGASPALQLIFEDNSADGPFEAVIVATPCEQAVDLLEEPAPALAIHAASARSAPCWAALLAFDQKIACGFDGLKSNNGPLWWMARNASKPGRAGIETWVVHASPDWSQANLDRGVDDIAAELTAAFQIATGAPSPTFKTAHRWRYALIETPADQAAYWDAATGIGVCGDWCIGPRVEAAWQSGKAIAEKLLR